MRMQTMLCMAAILTTCVCANGQPFFEDDFEDGAISPTLWQTNNQGWYSYTDVWLDA